MEIRSVGIGFFIGQKEWQTEGQRNVMNLQSNLPQFSRGLSGAVYFWVYLFSQSYWDVIWEIVTSCTI